MAPSRRRGTFFGAAIVVVVLDQLTKYWALERLADGPIDVVGSLRFNLAFNNGAAFSLGGGGGNTRLIAVLGLVRRRGGRAHGVAAAEERSWALGWASCWAARSATWSTGRSAPATGSSTGRVVDFIDLQWWPVFNVADISLWVGVGVLLLASRFAERTRRDRSSVTWCPRRWQGSASTGSSRWSPA